jgi:hypothetical protein
MSTSPITTSEAEGGRSSRTAAAGWTAFGVLIIATLVERALTLWHPDFPADDTFDYDAVAPIRDTWWALHFLGGIAVIMQAVAFVVAVFLLVQTRGSRWALGGATIYVLGAAAFGAGIAAEGVAFAYATDPAAIPVAQGSQLLNFMGEHSGLYLAGILPGLALTALGTVALCIALLRARTIPKVIMLVLLAGTAIQLILAFGVVAFLISTVTITLPMLAIGWYATRTH